MSINSTRLAFVFPGQGSQYLGMGQEMANEHDHAEEMFTLADSILDSPITPIMWGKDCGDIDETHNTQPAIYLHSIIVYTLFNQQFPQIKPVYLAGHSLGEITALVVGGSISWQDGLLLVQERGRLMKKAGLIAPGGMTAVIGIDEEIVRSICEEASTAGVIELANINSPSQYIISGSLEALMYAENLAQQRGAKRITRLPVSIAAHSGFMECIQAEYGNFVSQVQITEPDIPIISNITAQPLTSADMIREELVDQLTSSLLWVDSVNYIIDEGCTTFIEFGPKNILSRLIKRIHKDTNLISFQNHLDIRNLNLSNL